MTRRLLALAFLSAPMIVGCYGDPPAAAGDRPDAGGSDLPDECLPATPAGKETGFPYNLESFKSDALPVLTAKCGTVGCHAGPTGVSNFTIFADAATDECNLGKTFNEVAKMVTLTAPATSRLLVAPSGGSARHPNVLPSTDPGYATLKAYIDDAVLRAASDGGNAPDAGVGAGGYDKTVFQNTIQPMLDSTGCTASTCHGAGIAGVTLKPNATGADLDANFTTVTTRNNATTPEQSRMYFKGVNSHSGSRTYSAANARAFLDWVNAGS